MLKEDFFEESIEVLVPDIKFYGPLFQAILSLISVFCLCKDHKVNFC